MAFNPYLSGPAVSPYLSGMADDIGRRSNLQLQQGLQGIRSNSVMDGGFGGSRQGVAEGAAMSNAADTLQGNLSNMYNTDYQASQNRDLQRYGIEKQAQSAKYGADSALQGSMYGADNSLKGSMHSADTSLQGSMYGSDSALKGSMYGTDASTHIAGMNNATTQRGQDQNYNLGMGQNQIGLQNANTNATQVGNQYTLGQGQNANQATANQNSYSLGTSQNANQATANQNSYNLGQGQNANQATANQNSYRLGVGNLQLGAQNNANAYDLGLRGNDLGYATLDANTYQNNVSNQFNAARLGLDVQGSLQSGNSLGINEATQMQNTPLNYYNQFNGAATNLGNAGGGSTAQTTSQGDPLLSALGGAQLGSKFAKNLGFGDSSMAMTNGGGFTNTPNYLITS